MENSAKRRMTTLLPQTLKDLLAEKTLEKISINDICDRAYINHSSFYRYYGSKYDLLADAMPLITDDIFKGDYHKITDVDYTRRILYWAVTNRKLVKNLTTHNEHYDTHMELVRYSAVTIKHAIATFTPEELAKRPILTAIVNAPMPDLCIDAFCSAVLGVILVLADRDSVSTDDLDQLVAYLTNLFTN